METETGHVLFRRLDKGNELFIVVKGQCAVYSQTVSNFDYKHLGGLLNGDLDQSTSRLEKIFTFFDSNGKKID